MIPKMMLIVGLCGIIFSGIIIYAGNDKNIGGIVTASGAVHYSYSKPLTEHQITMISLLVTSSILVGSGLVIGIKNGKKNFNDWIEE